jgi:hypothetical protein
VWLCVCVCVCGCVGIWPSCELCSSCVLVLTYSVYSVSTGRLQAANHKLPVDNTNWTILNASDRRVTASVFRRIAVTVLVLLLGVRRTVTVMALCWCTKELGDLVCREISVQYTKELSALICREISVAYTKELIYLVCREITGIVHQGIKCFALQRD